MKKIIILISVVILFAFSCKNEVKVSEKSQIPKVQVKVTNVTEGYLPDYISVTGRTVYLNKNTIVAPISGYITKVDVITGDRVNKRKVLFEMQSPEAYMMQKKDSLAKNYGVVKIYAPTGGVISVLNVMQKGVFVDQGSALCLVVASNDLKVQVNVPFEYRKYVKIGSKCKIMLPDSTIIKGRFTKMLPQMNEQSQTVKVLANLNTNMFIPEDMIVKVLIDKGIKHKTQILSKKCLLTDALMTKFWVMKLINDTVAVNLPVVIGNQTLTQVEIIKPKFSNYDRIISEGGYGLSDTSFVEIVR